MQLEKLCSTKNRNGFLSSDVQGGWNINIFLLGNIAINVDILIQIEPITDDDKRRKLMLSSLLWRLLFIHTFKIVNVTTSKSFNC